jgi:iron complex transport system ATP-binding protein
MTSTLEARELSAAYDRQEVLHRLSIAVQPGQALGIIGPNGAGKTTFLNSLAGLLTPKEGVVLVNGRDMSGLGDRERAQYLGLVPQIEAQTWPVTVNHLVSLGRAAHRGWLMPLTEDDLRVVDKALERTALSDLRKRPVTSLSGGERQRALIARALAQQPRVLLLDEPTAHLDLRYQATILGLVRELVQSEEGLAVVMSLHDLNLAALFSDRLALLSEGELRAVGEPRDVLTASLLSEVYGVDVVVGEHPVHGTPLVAPVLQIESEGMV